MNPARPRYRARFGTIGKDRAENVASKEAIVDLVKPPILKENNDKIKRGRGALKKVVTDFVVDDERADKLGKFIMQGLAPYEAGLLAGYSPENLKELQAKSAVYRRYVEQQLIKFKQHHLEVIMKKPDARTSQWLLERTFPAEFSPKRPLNDGGSGDRMVIAAIFKTIQEQGDSPIPMKAEYTDVTSHHESSNRFTDEKETEDDSPSSESRQHQPSLEPGGANII
jgi:hypothetical protein